MTHEMITRLSAAKIDIICSHFLLSSRELKDDWISSTGTRLLDVVNRRSMNIITQNWLHIYIYVYIGLLEFAEDPALSKVNIAWNIGCLMLKISRSF